MPMLAGFGGGRDGEMRRRGGRSGARGEGAVDCAGADRSQLLAHSQAKAQRGECRDEGRKATRRNDGEQRVEVDHDQQG